MKKWITGLTVLAAVFSAQATTIDFNEAAYSTAGDGAALSSLADWTGNPDNVLADTTGDGCVLLATGSTAWKYNTYSAEAISTANAGDSITTTIQFTFDSTATGTGNTGVGASKRIVAVGSSVDNMYGWLCRSWDSSVDGKYALGYNDDNDPNKVILDGSDIGIDSLTVQTSDLLQLTTTLTREAGDTWAMDIVLQNLDTAFTTSYHATGLGVAVDSMIGAFGTGQSDANSSVTARTITSFEVIPEPATISMLGMGALITLLVRKMRG
jgi:hypothetical protein